MANPTIFTAEQNYIGLGKETSNGTATTPTRFLPFKTFTPAPNNGLIVDDAVYGSMTTENGAVAGPQSATHDLSTYFYADTVGDLLDNMFGGYAVTGTGPYTHTFSLKNDGDGQPQAHTITDYTGITATVGARAYAYACLSELTFSGNATGLVTVEGKLTSYIGKPAASAPTNTTTSNTVLPGWQSSVTVAGTAVPIREWSVTMSRDLVVDPLANGSQDPNSIARKGMAVAGKLTFAAKDEQPVVDFLAGTQQAIAVTITNGGSGTALRSLVLTATKGVYSDESMARETPIGFEMGFKGLSNTTDVGSSGGRAPIKAVLSNGITSYT